MKWPEPFTGPMKRGTPIPITRTVLSGTGDAITPPCLGCGRPEHGNLACDYPFAIAFDPEQPGLPVKYRIMDDQLFEIHPGSPMNEDDHCCLCAWRRNIEEK